MNDPQSMTGATLAASFEHANAQLVNFVQQLSDTQWRTPCEREGRTVGVVVYHIAAGYIIVADLIDALANGATLPNQTHADSFNAAQAEEHAECTRAEALNLLHRNSVHVASTLRALSDEQLVHTALSPRGRVLTIETAVEHGLLAHLNSHFEAVRETLQPMQM